MFKRISLIDSLVRIAIFTTLCLFLARVYTNFEYSLVSYILFAVTFTAAALPPKESITAFILTLTLNILFPQLSPQRVFVLDSAITYNIVILNKILLITTVIPIVVFAVLKKIWKPHQLAITTIIGLSTSWITYALAIPLIYAIVAKISTEGNYLMLFRHLFSKNIFIHILLAVIIFVFATFIWNRIEKRNLRISKNIIK